MGPPWVALRAHQTRNGRRLLSLLAKVPSQGNALCGPHRAENNFLKSDSLAAQSKVNPFPLPPLCKDVSRLGWPRSPRTDVCLGTGVCSRRFHGLRAQDLKPDGILQLPRNSLRTWSRFRRLGLGHRCNFPVCFALKATLRLRSRGPHPNRNPTHTHTQASFRGRCQGPRASAVRAEGHRVVRTHPWRCLSPDLALSTGHVAAGPSNCAR